MLGSRIHGGALYLTKVRVNEVLERAVIDFVIRKRTHTSNVEEEIQCLVFEVLGEGVDRAFRA